MTNEHFKSLQRELSSVHFPDLSRVLRYLVRFHTLPPTFVTQQFVPALMLSAASESEDMATRTQCLGCAAVALRGLQVCLRVGEVWISSHARVCVGVDLMGVL